MAWNYQKPDAKAFVMRVKDFPPQFTACGECGVIITLGDGLDMETNARAVILESYIREKFARAENCDYVLESAPLLRSVFLRYDVRRVDFDTVVADLRSILPKALGANFGTNSGEGSGEGGFSRGYRLWHLPICYEGDYAPDIEDLARLMDLSVAETVLRHAAAELQVLMLGFAPGWIYGGLLPEIWDVPRLSTAKPDVAAGSISVAVRQVIISATVAPTGWRTMGRTPYLNFDLRRQEAFTMCAGDRIRIEKISVREFDLLEKEFSMGERHLSYEDIA